MRITGLVLVPVAPIGTEKVLAFVDYTDGTGEFTTLDRQVYPPHPDGKEFRRLRVARSISLREAAKRLGITAADVSGLEFGRLVPRDGWLAVYERMGGAP